MRRITSNIIALGRSANYAFAPKQHFDLGEALGQMDFETAAKLSGARFVVLKKGLARLERALGQFMLDVHTGEPHNYTEIAPPLLVRDETMFGTGQLRKFRDDQFSSFSRRSSMRGNRTNSPKASCARCKLRRQRTSSCKRSDRCGCHSSKCHQSRAPLAHPHRRSPADQSRPRIHRRRSATADALSPPARRASAPKRAPRARTRAA